MSVKNNIDCKVAEYITDSTDQSNFSEFAVNYAKYLVLHQEKKSILKAISFLDTAVRRYMTFYQSQSITGNWSIKLIEHFCKLLKDIAYIAEENYQTVKEETKDVVESPLKIVKTCLETIFNKCQGIKEPFPNSRKMGAFFAIIKMCEIYFRDGKFRMCLR